MCRNQRSGIDLTKCCSILLVSAGDVCPAGFLDLTDLWLVFSMNLFETMPHSEGNLFHKHKADSATNSLRKAIPNTLFHDSYSGPIYSLGYELWITVNSLFLSCLTCCGQMFLPDGCCFLDSLTLILSPTSHSWSQFYCLLIKLHDADASVAQGEEGSLSLWPSDPLWGPNPPSHLAAA